MIGVLGCVCNFIKWEFNFVNLFGFVIIGFIIVFMVKLIVRGVDVRVVNRNKMCYFFCDFYDLWY